VSRTCKQCGESKPDTEFRRRRSCRQCCIEAMRAHRAKLRALTGKTPEELRSRRRHGDAGHMGKPTPEYNAWRGMWRRTTGEYREEWVDYGGRGITVCDRWRSYENFLDDMGPRPSPLHSIDRKDNDGPYSPDNCRWATKSQQARNTRKTRRITMNGETLTVYEWAEKIGIPVRTIKWRLSAGWSEDRALTHPPRGGI
jgi:hypothetical protein